MELTIIDPNIFTIPAFELFSMTIGPISLKWYGLMYLLGLISAWLLAHHRAKKSTNWTPEHISDVIFYAFLGIVIGGRVGYVIFYQFDRFISEPLYLLKITEGGMSFHGGFLGVLLAFLYFGRKANKTFFEISDFFAPFVPIGLGLGRIGNFINGELYGRIADASVPWAMRFPSDPDYLLRHPSQLYQAFLEGLLLFILLMWFSAKPRPRMAVSGLFALAYGCFRFFVEFYRQPDAQLGLLQLNLSMGQWLSMPMIVLGVYLLYLAYKNAPATKHP
ncbi:MAG: prolipoprotein diacylglyceryl transferase [Gammaproteobacteria bacterium]|nr:prolipoprotein diacylglyceryl transferase [Gammaproteobacteria bacterium]NNJ72820.1 prolipoprotein diacylglyceryl transferase [Enterobacterales bacterium]